MAAEFTPGELEAFLDEALHPAEMAEVERAMRDDPELSRQLAAIIGRRDAGMHSLGAIWRRHRVSCPSREQLGGYLLEALAEEHCEYIAFHIEMVGCRLCQANLDDLRRRRREASDIATTRRAKYFQSSAGYL